MSIYTKELIDLLNRPAFSVADAMALVSLGAAPNTKNNQGVPLFHFLIHLKAMKEAYELIKVYKGNINVTNAEGQTVLDCIREGIFGNGYTIKNIINIVRLGANANSIDSQGTPLLHLLMTQNKLFLDEITELVQQHKADINATNTEGRTLLKNVLNTPDFNVEDAMALVRLGANPDSTDFQGTSLLHLLIRKKEMKLIDELLRKHGAHINITNSQGKSPLQCLLDDPLFATEDAMNFVVLGANPNTKNSKGISLLSLLVSRKALNEAKILGSRIDALNKTPLHLLMDNPLFVVNKAMELVRLGADVNTKDSNGVSLLSKLIQCKAIKQARELIQIHHAKINIDEISDIKEVFFIYFKTLALNERIGAFLDALDPENPLGQLMRTKRGFLNPDLTRGTLSLIYNELLMNLNMHKIQQRPAQLYKIMQHNAWSSVPDLSINKFVSKTEALQLQTYINNLPINDRLDSLLANKCVRQLLYQKLRLSVDDTSINGLSHTREMPAQIVAAENRADNSSYFTSALPPPYANMYPTFNPLASAGAYHYQSLPLPCAPPLDNFNMDLTAPTTSYNVGLSEHNLIRSREWILDDASLGNEHSYVPIFTFEPPLFSENISVTPPFVDKSTILMEKPDRRVSRDSRDSTDSEHLNGHLVEKLQAPSEPTEPDLQLLPPKQALSPSGFFTAKKTEKEPSQASLPAKTANSEIRKKEPSQVSFYKLAEVQAEVIPVKREPRKRVAIAL